MIDGHEPIGKGTESLCRYCFDAPDCYTKPVGNRIKLKLTTEVEITDSTGRVCRLGAGVCSYAQKIVLHDIGHFTAEEVHINRLQGLPTISVLIPATKDAPWAPVPTTELIRAVEDLSDSLADNPTT